MVDIDDSGWRTVKLDTSGMSNDKIKIKETLGIIMINFGVLTSAQRTKSFPIKVKLWNDIDAREIRLMV